MVAHLHRQKQLYPTEIGMRNVFILLENKRLLPVTAPSVSLFHLRTYPLLGNELSS